MSIYDVNGFVVEVEGPADRVFSEEFGYFRIAKAQQKIDLFVRVNEEHRFLPTRAYGIPKGMFIPFDENENTLLYDEGMEVVRPLDRFLDGIEFLMWWPDKAWLHAGAVVKKGKAYAFTGEGGVGKTSIVLNLLREGYDYLSDDWLIVGGGKAFPLPKRIHVFDYNLRDKEIARRALGHKRLYYLPMCRLLEFGSDFSPHKYIRYLFGRLRERTFLRVRIHKMFPEVKVACPSSISKVFLLERKKADRVEVRKDVDSEKLARKMAYYSMYEWHNMLREYYRYVHLFGIRNGRIENRLCHDSAIMNETFGECDLYRVIVPEGLDLSKIDLISLFGMD